MRPGIIILLLFIGTQALVFGQHADPGNTSQLNRYQDSLVILGDKIVNDSSSPERLSSSYSFARLLVKALKSPHSFNYPFDLVKTISIRYSPDRKFRIFSWHVQFDDGSYRYYGAIQMNNVDGKLVLHGLVDHTPAIANPKDTVTSADRWYGAQYYSIIPVYGSRPYYLLLGWKGNNVKINGKVIEVLSFKEGKPVLGMAVFDGDKENSLAKRIIFKYSRQATMNLNYQQSDNSIIFDHIAPLDPKMKGVYESYGPDMSYDAFKLTGGRWRLVQDIPLTNPPSKTDENYNDPKFPDKIKGTIRKL